MDGETAEWEEEMVADIVVTRADRVALIREIGRAYPSMNGSDDFRKGLNKLEWQLDGARRDPRADRPARRLRRSRERERRVVVTPGR